MKRWTSNFGLSCSTSEWKTSCASNMLNTIASQLSSRPEIASLSMERHRHSKVSFGQKSLICIISQMAMHCHLFECFLFRFTVGRLVTSIVFSFWYIHIFKIHSIVALIERPSISFAKFTIWVS